MRTDKLYFGAACCDEYIPLSPAGAAGIYITTGAPPAPYLPSWISDHFLRLS